MLRSTISSLGLSDIKPVADKNINGANLMIMVMGNVPAFTASANEIGKVTIMPLPNDPGVN